MGLDYAQNGSEQRQTWVYPLCINSFIIINIIYIHKLKVKSWFLKCERDDEQETAEDCVRCLAKLFFKFTFLNRFSTIVFHLKTRYFNIV